jgi:hypothetical protein
MKTAITFIVLFATIFACSKKTPMKYSSFSYEQTYCSDQWGTHPSDSLTLIKLGQYLDSLSLYRAGLDIKQQSQPQLCNACNCKTGKVLYVTTFETEKDKFNAIGFK